ncbi:MAG: FxsA family protein [Roseinatronobacter sp.]
MPVLLIFLALPLIEIALFVAIGGQIGVLATLLWVLASAAMGIALMRREPQRSSADIRQALAVDASPASPMAHSALRMLGALLLAAPGFLTDALGLLLLLAPVRSLMLARFLPRTMTRAHPARDDIIDGDYTTEPDPIQPHLPIDHPGPYHRD